MSDADTPARPRQLTTAACFVIVASALLVVSVFDRLGSLDSVETRDAVTQTVQDADGLGMSVEGVLTAMRVGLQVSAVCAAVAVVLGVFVLQRHRGARIALGVLAVPILLTAPLTGSFLGAVVAAAIAMLWSGPARDWYAGRPVRQAPQRAEKTERTGPPTPEARRPEPPHDPATEPQEASRPTLSTGATSTAPRPSQGYGEAPAAPYAPAPQQPTWQQPVQQPAEQPAQQHPYYADPAWSRGPAHTPTGQHPSTPVGVRIACLLTWVCAVVVVLVTVVAMVLVTRDTTAVLDELRANPSVERAGLTTDGLLATMWVVVVMMIGWALAAMVLAVFVWRRHDWARYLLVLSTAAAFIAAVFAFPFGLPLQAACAATLVLLLNRPARAWFGHGSSSAPDRPVW